MIKINFCEASLKKLQQLYCRIAPILEWKNFGGEYVVVIKAEDYLNLLKKSKVSHYFFCTQCGSEQIKKWGYSSKNKQVYKCKKCEKTWVSHLFYREEKTK